MAEKVSFGVEEIPGDALPHLEESPLARHIEAGGCFSIWGPIAICWKVIGPKIEVCLKLGPLPGPCGTIDAANLCAKLEGSVQCVKASIEVCLEGKCLVYKGRGCYRDLPCFNKPWKCAELKGTIVCL
jgi:hypothetical protein